jgi:GNAT superfamily N-acetyltransferase
LYIKTKEMLFEKKEPTHSVVNSSIYLFNDNKYIGQIEYRKNSCAIWYLFVEPIYRRQGYGTALLKELEKTLINQGCKSIEVNPSSSAIPFYKKNGFTIRDDMGPTYSRMFKDLHPLRFKIRQFFSIKEETLYAG